MPVPRVHFVDIAGPDMFESIENGLWSREFEDHDSACQCPWRRYGGCVDDLGLPPRFEPYVHHDGRRGVFVMRTRKHDPTTMTVLQTAVTFEHVNSDGRHAKWALKCALLGPAV
ncbi:hypothetical protein [Kitasatospora purpeofusca]|uniref:hypothetical protein n=1 Tax=Kitasatospora purpeofusca TaxID=67352 RepID=UPI00386C0F51|nr:hypothetical protein OIP63_11105 [Kitasatospora purpeofusca]